MPNLQRGVDRVSHVIEENVLYERIYPNKASSCNFWEILPPMEGIDFQKLIIAGHLHLFGEVTLATMIIPGCCCGVPRASAHINKSPKMLHPQYRWGDFYGGGTI